MRRTARPRQPASKLLSRRALLAGACALVPALGFGARERPLSAGEAKVVITTTDGKIIVVADTARAPLSAGDFLRYVDQGLFDGGEFYRSVRPENDLNPVKIAVIQGGIVDAAKKLPPIAHETTRQTGLRHRNGTVSLARAAPGTGSGGSFFICIGDQPGLDYGGRRNPDGLGFAAFGQVVAGMDVIRSIWMRKTRGTDGALAAQAIESPVKFLSVLRAATGRSEQSNREPIAALIQQKRFPTGAHSSGNS
jgi:peptidyl-prolyl cis-trans isomerase A (cyclophilin A)